MHSRSESKVLSVTHESSVDLFSLRLHGDETSRDAHSTRYAAYNTHDTAAHSTKYTEGKEIEEGDAATTQHKRTNNESCSDSEQQTALYREDPQPTTSTGTTVHRRPMMSLSHISASILPLPRISHHGFRDLSSHHHTTLTLTTYIYEHIHDTHALSRALTSTTHTRRGRHTAYSADLPALNDSTNIFAIHLHTHHRTAATTRQAISAQ